MNPYDYIAHMDGTQGENWSDDTDQIANALREYASIKVQEYHNFFKKICELTSNHKTINGHACVTADDLGNALETIDKNWYKK